MPRLFPGQDSGSDALLCFVPEQHLNDDGGVADDHRIARSARTASAGSSGRLKRPAPALYYLLGRRFLSDLPDLHQQKVRQSHTGHGRPGLDPAVQGILN